jgi:hypothetical protein
MKRALMMILLFTCACKELQAQVNYVLNPSMEKYSQCPTHFDQIRLANYWSQIDTSIVDPLCSAEYCNSCAGSNPYVGVPNNGGFYHYPRSGNGLLSAMFYFDSSYYPEPDQRDYLQGRLYTHLTAGTRYCITFYTASQQWCKYAIDHIGAYLDDGSIDAGKDSINCAAVQTAYHPQIFSTTIINDTLNWVKIQGSFTAAGNERFITIGNFFDKSHTNAIVANATLGNGYEFAFYLVDDVSVIESTQTANAGPDVVVSHGDSVHIGTSEEGMPCTWYKLGSSTPIGYSGGIWVRPNVTTQYVVEMDLCGNVTRDTVKVAVDYTKAPSFSPQGGVMVYPNPAANELVIEHAVGSEVVMIDVVGRVVYHSMLATAKEILDVHGLQKGVYVVQIIDVATGYRVARKVVKE